VLGFLIIGLVLGPYGLAQLANEQTWLHHFLITDVAGVRALAELGVVLLLFMIGLDLSLERLWAMRAGRLPRAVVHRGGRAVAHRAGALRNVGRARWLRDPARPGSRRGAVVRRLPDSGRSCSW